MKNELFSAQKINKSILDVTFANGTQTRTTYGTICNSLTRFTQCIIFIWIQYMLCQVTQDRTDYFGFRISEALPEDQSILTPLIMYLLLNFFSAKQSNQGSKSWEHKQFEAKMYIWQHYYNHKITVENNFQTKAFIFYLKFLNM